MGDSTDGFAAELRRLRLAARLTQEELAERAGLAARSIRAMERGQSRHPRPESVRLLAAALGLDGPARARLQEVASRRYWTDRNSGLPDPEPAPGAPALRPAQLPAAVTRFVGRDAELAQLQELLSGSGSGSGDAAAVVVSAVSGTAGVGKTALALHWAHQAAAAFPDGQLYVDLRGYDPDQPVPAADALAGFLRALGVDGAAIPFELSERAAAYRSLLAGRRVLVVLDNAGSAEQVWPLLPGTPCCPVVVTSRDSLSGLVARHGARRIDLDLLPLGDAVRLLGELIGERVTAEPAAAQALAGYCARLPLALRITAELAVSRPTATLAALAGELADEQRRLTLLDAGQDPRTAVRAVFSRSYQRLGADQALLFRLLGLHPGPDVDVDAAAALAGLGVADTVRGLDVLTRAHLAYVAAPGRYRMHDLLRVYAAELVVAEDGEETRRAALTRLYDHYLATAAAAVAAVQPAEPRPPMPLTTRAEAAPPEPAAAQAWLDAERATLLTVAGAAVRDWPAHVAALGTVLWRDLFFGGHQAEALTLHQLAIRAARATGDRRAEAMTLVNLGLVYQRWAMYGQFLDHLRTALAIARETGDRAIELRATGNLGTVSIFLGRYEEAAGHLRRTLELARDGGSRSAEARALSNVGVVEEQLGRYPAAAGHYRAAVGTARDCNDRHAEGMALANLGDVELRVARYGDAEERYREALAVFRGCANPDGEARALAGLAAVERRRGRPDEALPRYEEAHLLFVRTGHRDWQAKVLAGMGGTWLELGRPEEARDHLQRALELCRESGSRATVVSALVGLADCLEAAGEPDPARAAYDEALAEAVASGDPYEEARARLGLGRLAAAAGNPAEADRQRRRGLALCGQLGVPAAADPGPRAPASSR